MKRKGEIAVLSSTDSTTSEHRVEAQAMPGHLVALPGGDWALWRWAGVRGAGFPILKILELASPECAAMADRLISAEDHTEEVWRQALSALRQELQDSEPERQAILSKAMKKLRNGKAPGVLPADCRSARRVAEFAAAGETLDQTYAEFRHAHERATSETSQALSRIVQLDAFREAVIWQNRQAFHTAIARLLAAPPPNACERNKRRRHSEELVANYWQRYCAKNDTIGFFGPVGWARLGADSDALAVRPGQNLIASRSVHFSDWCIDALAEAAAGDEVIRPWLAPCQNPIIVGIDHNTLHLPLGRSVSLNKQEAELLSACDGQRSAREIAQSLINSRDSALHSETEVFQLLEDMAGKEWVFWRPRVAATAHPERDLLQALNQIGDERAHKRALAPYHKIEAIRRDIQRAAGNAEKLDAALSEMEETFTSLTGVAPTRAEGQMYATRTLVYEDCRRDIEVILGRPLLEAVAPTLSLILMTARWLTYHLAASYNETFRKVYDKLSREFNSAPVDAPTFWANLQPVFYGDRLEQSADLTQKMLKSWTEILAVPPGQSSVHYTSAALRPKVMAAFDAPAPGWKNARYHSPDLMIAASSLEAIRRGDYQLVLGEVHITANTLSYAFFVEQHPMPEELFKATEIDFPEPRAILMSPKSWARKTARAQNVIVSEKDCGIEYAADSPSLPGMRSLPIGSLVVTEGPDGLILQTRDASLRFDIMDALAEVLIARVTNSLRLLIPGPHAPRVTIDKVVVCRETWCFPAAELDFANEKADSPRFLAARRWARQNGLPRFVFYKSPVEVKPCFLDFDSPLLIDLFAKVVRRTQRQPASGDSSYDQLTITEMLPTPEQVWLPDAEGQRYASELRLVAVDLSGWSLK